jgi:hypothetical protein
LESEVDEARRSMMDGDILAVKIYVTILALLNVSV